MHSPTSLPLLVSLPDKNFSFCPHVSLLFRLIPSSLSRSSSHLLYSPYYAVSSDFKWAKCQQNSNKWCKFSAAEWFPVITQVFRCCLIVPDNASLSFIFQEGCNHLSPYSHFFNLHSTHSSLPLSSRLLSFSCLPPTLHVMGIMVN